MRVLIATDAIAPASSFEVGAMLGRAFRDRGAQVAVVPMGVAGPALREALEALGHQDDVIDLTAGDPGEIPAGAIGIVAADELLIPLVGLHGLAATRGRQAGWDLADVLVADDEQRAMARTLWPANPDACDAPGSGAHDGLGLRVLAAGGRLTTGPSLCSELAGLAATAKAADLLVTGCETFDFGSFGGPVVAELIRVANAAARPLVSVARRNYVSARELRQAGIEAVHAGDGVDEPSLVALADRVAAAWTW